MYNSRYKWFEVFFNLKYSSFHKFFWLMSTKITFFIFATWITSSIFLHKLPHLFYANEITSCVTMRSTSLWQKKIASHSVRRHKSSINIGLQVGFCGFYVQGQVNKFLENLSEGTRNVMSHYFLTSSIS